MRITRACYSATPTCLGERILSAITPLDVQSAYQKMIDRGLSARTVRYTHSVLRSAMRQAIRWRLQAQDPTDGAQLPRLRRREMRVLDADQSRAFLSAALKLTTAQFLQSLSPPACAHRNTSR